MLSKEMNETITRVGPGTPLGELMRRYWHPVAGSADLLKNPVKSVRILGEDLTLYKDRQGRLGLIGQRCPHRSVDLKFGIPEQEGLRCPYHGWMFDGTGQCIETPLEPPDSTFKDRIKIKGYPVQELGGLVFAYLGPEPAPLLPRWDLMVWPNAFRQIAACVIPCNWLQCQENSVDPTHNEYLHGRLFQYALERKGPDATQGRDPAIMRANRSMRHHVKIAFDLYKYGIIKRRLLEGQSEDAPDWKTGHPLVFPNMVRLGGGMRNELQFRVPIDDTHTWHLNYQSFAPGPDVEVPKQDVIPIFDVPMQDENGEYILDYVLAQDMVAWWAQGEITDRSEEKLGQTDRGIILYRRLLMEQIKKVQAGEDPLCTFRDPAENECIDLHVGDVRDMVQGRAMLHRGYAVEDVERYSPVLDQLLDLYRRVEEAQQRKQADPVAAG